MNLKRSDHLLLEISCADCGCDRGGGRETRNRAKMTQAKESDRMLMLKMMKTMKTRMIKGMTTMMRRCLKVDCDEPRTPSHRASTSSLLEALQQTEERLSACIVRQA